MKQKPVSLSSQTWGVILGAMGVGLGLFILLVSLPSRSVAVGIAATPVIVREGLIVKGSGPELYILKDHKLHQLASPTPRQSAQAQPVADSFLGRYAHGIPLDSQGR